METERNWNGDGERERSAVRTMKDKAASQAQDAREQMRSLADAGREEVANQLEGFARAFSDAGDSLRSQEQGTAGRYTELIGEQARNASQYFREHDADALIQETESFARRQPLVFLGGCLVAGFAIGRFLHASPPDEGRLPAGVGSGEAIVRRPQTAPVGMRVETAPVRPVGAHPEPVARPEQAARPEPGPRNEPGPWNGGER